MRALGMRPVTGPGLERVGLLDAANHAWVSSDVGCEGSTSDGGDEGEGREREGDWCED